MFSLVIARIKNIPVLLFRKRLKGGALYYSLFISFIISLIIVFFILLSYHHNKYLLNRLQKERLYHDTRSALNIYISNPSIVDHEEEKAIDLYNDGISIVNLKKEQWGAYEVINANEDFFFYKVEKTALAGIDIFKGEPLALYLVDKGKYLCISGETHLQGTCYLPKIGIKRAYIEGKSYQGDRLVAGETKISKENLPHLNEMFLNSNEHFLNMNFRENDSVVEYSLAEKSNKISNSFHNKPLILYSNKNLYLSHKNISGNVIICSQGNVELDDDLIINDVIIYANKIKVKKRFKGQVQLFARDSVVIEENCKLLYPSFVGLINTSINNIAMEIKENSILEGGLVIFQKQQAMQMPKLTLHENSEVHGQVYCKGSVEFKGKIIGSLYCETFSLKTKSAFYENHLLDAKISFHELNPFFAGCNITDDANMEKKIIKWLY